MELKTNSNHKKIDVRNLKGKLFPNFTVSIGTIALTVSLLSGCGIVDKYKTAPSEANAITSMYVDSLGDMETVDTHGCLFDVEFDDGRIVDSIEKCTYGDLKHVVSATVASRYNLSENDNIEAYVNNFVLNNDYSFLNYMPNLKKLTLLDLTSSNSFSSIDGSKLPSGISISLQNCAGFNVEGYGFLRDIPSIDTLTIGSAENNYVGDINFIQDLRNVQNLSLFLDYGPDFKYKDLTFLESLSIGSGRPYDISMCFSNDNLDEMERAGVKINIPEIDKVRDINNRISNIASTFDLNENSTDQEKLNAILRYVLENYHYDENVMKSYNGESVEMKNHNETFYREGMLTSALEDESQICGNYAAMVTMLSREVGLDSYCLYSLDHAWNAVKVGDYYYYVDSTWLDQEVINIGTIKNGDFSKGQFLVINNNYKSASDIFKNGSQENMNRFKWYLNDPTDVSDISHTVIGPPEELQLLEIPDSVELGKAKDISKDIFNIKIDKMIYQVSGAVLMGILAGLGFSEKIDYKKNKSIIKQNEGRGR